MKKIIAYLYSLTNATPSERASVLFRMLPKDTESQINTLECLKALVDADLLKKEKLSKYELKLINQYFPKTLVRDYSPCFEPLHSEIN